MEQEFELVNNKPTRRPNEDLRDYLYRCIEWRKEIKVRNEKAKISKFQLFRFRITLWVADPKNRMFCFLTFALITVSFNFLFYLNKYYLPSAIGYAYSESEYKELMKSLPMDERSSYALSTKAFYFGILPEWTINIFYPIYLILAILTIRFIVYRDKIVLNTHKLSYGHEQERLQRRISDAQNRSSQKDLIYFEEKLKQLEIDKYKYFKKEN